MRSIKIDYNDDRRPFGFNYKNSSSFVAFYQLRLAVRSVHSSAHLSVNQKLIKIVKIFKIRFITLCSLCI